MTTLGESIRKVQEERKNREPRVARGYISNDKIYVYPHELLKDIGYVSKDVFQCTICNEWHEDIAIARNCCDIESVKKGLNGSQNRIADTLRKLEFAKKDYRDACDWHKTLEMKLNKLQLQKRSNLAEGYGMNAEQVRACMDDVSRFGEQMAKTAWGCIKCGKPHASAFDAAECCGSQIVHEKSDAPSCCS